jgi:hypothetical protein
MLKEVLASNVAKMVAACVCPVVGAGVVALEVPKVRDAVHKATAPKAKKPQRTARAKPRVREVKDATDRPDQDIAPLQTAMMCPQPLAFQNASLEPRTAPISLPLPRIESRPERVYVASGCPSVRIAGGDMGFRFATVPEPATWAQMIGGFALMGAALRTRRHKRVTRAS